MTAAGLFLGLFLWFRPRFAEFETEHRELDWPRQWRTAFFAVLAGIVLVSAVGLDRSGGVGVQARWARSWHGFTWGAGIEAMRQAADPE